MVIIIDELDRCNPDFAVKTLEAIKQFYDNEKLIFIVATNNEQLCSTICKHYGEKFDSLSYLNKFYDITIHLDNIEMKNYLKYYLNFEDNSYYSKLIPIHLIKEMNLCFREINSYIAALRILDNYFENGRGFSDCHSIIKYLIVPYSLALKAKNIKIYKEFINGKGREDFVNIFTKNERMKNILIDLIGHDIRLENKEIDVIITEVYDALMNSKADDYNDTYRIGFETKKELLDILELISFI